MVCYQNPKLSSACNSFFLLQAQLFTGLPSKSGAFFSLKFIFFSTGSTLQWFVIIIASILEPIIHFIFDRLNFTLIVVIIGSIIQPVINFSLYRLNSP